jgi:hypothetical protein
MSMIVSICGYDGIVMAADSGASRHIAMSDIRLLFAMDRENIEQNLSFCFADNCNKIHLMQNDIAVSEGGQWLTSGEQGETRSARPLLDHFYSAMRFNAPGEAAEGLLEYVREKISPGFAAGFHVCGYDPAEEDEPPLPRLYFVNTQDHIVTSLDKGRTGVMQHSANEYMTPFSQMVAANLHSFNLQDTIDYAVFAIKASAMFEKFALLNNRINGHIDVLALTPSGAEWVSRKRLHAEGNQI